MRYEVTSMDDSADGMERLRNQDEFILIAYATPGTPVRDLCAQWQADLNSCARPDDFDFGAAIYAVENYCTDNFGDLARIIANIPAGVTVAEGAEEAIAALDGVAGGYDAHPRFREVIAILKEMAADTDDLGTDAVAFRLYVRDTASDGSSEKGGAG